MIIESEFRAASVDFFLELYYSFVGCETYFLHGKRERIKLTTAMPSQTFRHAIPTEFTLKIVCTSLCCVSHSSYLLTRAALAWHMPAHTHTDTENYSGFPAPRILKLLHEKWWKKMIKLIDAAGTTQYSSYLCTICVLFLHQCSWRN